ncbi:MAG: hypothetical protein ACRYGP_07900, partial [Janthinobacterium lividum]
AIQSVLDFAYDRTTPSKNDHRLAVDLLTLLDNNNAISIATAKSGFSKDPSAQDSLKTGSVTISTQSSSQGGGDTLNVYKGIKSPFGTDSDRGDTEHAWSILANLYGYSQPDAKGKLIETNGTAPAILELRNSPRIHLDGVKLNASDHNYLGPVARTRTAIGILKYLVTQPKVAFLSKLEYMSVRQETWNSETRLKNCGSADYYVLDPLNIPSSQIKDPEVYFDLEHDQNFHHFKEKVKRYLETVNGARCPFDFPLSMANNLIGRSDLGNFAIALGAVERNMLIIKSTDPVPGSHTSWNDGTAYYSIMPDDLISQRNLMLVSQFVTIQATSTPTPSVTSISPSGR